VVSLCQCVCVCVCACHASNSAPVNARDLESYPLVFEPWHANEPIKVISIYQISRVHVILIYAMHISNLIMTNNSTCMTVMNMKSSCILVFMNPVIQMG
jgi:hypothetical protein